MTPALCGRDYWDICQPVRRQKAHFARLKCFTNSLCKLSLDRHKEEKSPLNAERRQFSQITNPYVQTVSLLWQSAHKTHPCLTHTRVNEQESWQPLNPSPLSVSIFSTYKCYYRSRETAAGKQLHRSRRGEPKFPILKSPAAPLSP